MNVITLRPPGPPKPKFQKTIADAIVVTVKANNFGLINLEIKDDELSEILNSWDARALAAALIKAADRADRLWAKEMEDEHGGR